MGVCFCLENNLTHITRFAQLVQSRLTHDTDEKNRDPLVMTVRLLGAFAKQITQCIGESIFQPNGLQPQKV